MSEKTKLVKVVCVVVCFLVIVELTGCGYFLYPERRGQKPVGRVDPAIAVLDALGLLLFVVPGVIAFAVDITNGTLYFPSGHRHSSLPPKTEKITMIRVNASELNRERFEEIIEKYAGVPVRLDQQNLKIYELDRSENIEARLAEIEKSGYQKY